MTRVRVTDWPARLLRVMHDFWLGRIPTVWINSKTGAARDAQQMDQIEIARKPTLCSSGRRANRRTVAAAGRVDAA
jgi:hypothetical protein